MPYIKKDYGRRDELQRGYPALNAGELNYQIFFQYKHFSPNSNLEDLKNIINSFVKNFLGDKSNYQRYNDMTGALIRCGFELKRRLNIEANILIDILLSYNEEIDKYENLKIAENGDVE